MTTDQIAWTVLIVLAFLAVFFMWAALRAGSKSNRICDEVERKEYSKRNDIGGKK